MENVERPEFVAAAEALAAAFAKFKQPEGPLGTYIAHHQLGMLPEAMLLIAQGLTAMARTCSEEMPLHPQISELVDAIAEAQVHVSNASEPVKPAIRHFHAPEIERIENPRPGEEGWDKGKGL